MHGYTGVCKKIPAVIVRRPRGVYRLYAQIPGGNTVRDSSVDVAKAVSFRWTVQDCRGRRLFAEWIFDVVEGSVASEALENPITGCCGDGEDISSRILKTQLALMARAYGDIRYLTD